MRADASAGHGHRLLLHGLEQGRLRLGRRPVDLVGQHEVGENRPPLELEPAAASGDSSKTLVPIRSAGIRSGVNWIALELQVQRLGQRPDQQRLAQPRHAFEQHMAAGDQGGKGIIHDIAEPDNDLADLAAQRLEVRAELVELLFHLVGRLRFAHARLLGSDPGPHARLRVPSRCGPPRDRP